MDFNAPVQAVVTALRAVNGVGSASTNPSDIVAPGVLVQVEQLQPLTMGGWQVDLRLVLVVADTDGGPGPAAALSALLSAVLTYAQPDGPVTAQSVLLPANPAPLPGLLFPLTVRTDT